MSPAELAERYMEAHAECALDAVLDLFAEDAVLEDPVGSAPLQGEAIRAFFRATHARNGRLRIDRVGPVLACGDEASWHVRAGAERAGYDPMVDVIYTLRSDDAGRIRSLRAFFDLAAR